GEDEPAHLGIPAARLMTEMDTRFQQVLQLRLRHALPFLGFIRRRCHLARHPRRGPIARSNGVRDLPLAELEPLARSRPSRLLALHHPWIARQESLLAQLLAVLLVRQAQRPRDREPQCTRLSP